VFDAFKLPWLWPFGSTAPLIARAANGLDFNRSTVIAMVILKRNPATIHTGVFAGLQARQQPNLDCVLNGGMCSPLPCLKTCILWAVKMRAILASGFCALSATFHIADFLEAIALKTLLSPAMVFSAQVSRLIAIAPKSVSAASAIPRMPRLIDFRSAAFAARSASLGGRHLRGFLKHFWRNLFTRIHVSTKEAFKRNGVPSGNLANVSAPLIHKIHRHWFTWRTARSGDFPAHRRFGCFCCIRAFCD